MTQEDGTARFTFTWLALKLLGRGLYSNPWSALSELVANGLDAGAEDVYVYIDARDKSDATVEVIDNGSGMSREDIDTYVKVGHNRRLEAATSNDGNVPKPKGRKGIGKLAALFLSQKFFLESRHPEGVTSWLLDAREDRIRNDDYPELLSVERLPTTLNDVLWNAQASGTRLLLEGVDLTGYGAQSMSALGSRLANQFLLPDSQPPRIHLAVRNTDAETEPSYEVVTKSVAFGNFAFVARHFPAGAIQPADLAQALGDVTIPAAGLQNDEYVHTPTIQRFADATPDDESWASIASRVDLKNRTYDGIRYSLTGWIGVHSTIRNEAAQKNDERFVKNKFYNPAQLRVYVRGKLASDNLLSQLGITVTYANYIEGEISFDLLDDDDLPDIATANRQDFDETDGRVTLLKGLVRPIVTALIQERVNLAAHINGLVKVEKERRDTASKKHFAETLRNDLEQYDDEISDATRDELQLVITNKIQGEITPKGVYRVFISHSRVDRAFASFIDEVLRDRGARTEEVFYTSRAGSVERAMDESSLGDIVRESIVDANTLIFYLTSKNFLNSQFCLFEGGAGWATRGITEYLRLNMDYDSIPDFLTNGRSEVSMIENSDIPLSIDLNNYLIVGVFNPMIQHLNRGREIAGETLLEEFDLLELPLAAELKKLGKTQHDYRDDVLVTHWEANVDPDLPAYIAAYLDAGKDGWAAPPSGESA